MKGPWPALLIAALCAGIVIGTYSSIRVARALLAMWHRYQEKRSMASASPYRSSASPSWDLPVLRSLEPCAKSGAARPVRPKLSDHVR